MRKTVGPEYGDGVCEFSDSATGVERGRRPARRIVRKPRHRRVMERERERYISRSVGLLASEESIVTISFGDMRRGMACRDNHAAVLVAYAPTESMVAMFGG